MSRFFDPDFKPVEDERLRATFCPNWVVNELGEQAEFWAALSPLSPGRSPDVAVHPLAPNAARKVHLHDHARLRAVGRRLL